MSNSDYQVIYGSRFRRRESSEPGNAGEGNLIAASESDTVGYFLKLLGAPDWLS